MATSIQSIVDAARTTLIEEINDADSFWTDDELLVHAIAGTKDLWKQIIDLYQGHFVVTDSTNMSLLSGTTEIDGVPANLFRVLLVRPRVVGESSSNRGLVFKYRTITHPDFVQAEADRACEPRSRVIFYAVLNAGAPVAAPSIAVAPAVTADVLLTVKYVPVLTDVTLASNNPIPGESDMALRMFIIAWARAKNRPARDPDPEYVASYNTETRKILTACTPRSEQDPDVVESFMDWVEER